MSHDLQSRFFTASDGLRLHYLDVTPTTATSAPVAACLPGLTRTAWDFEPLARRLAGHSATPRRVLAFDYRGRGGSDFDPDWHHYDLPTERRDLLEILDHLGIESAHMIGTSRGGLHILAMGADRRELIRAVVLNDIGPVLEPAGLARIKGYVGKPAAPTSFDDAIAILKQGAGRTFDGLSDAQWRHFAAVTFGRDERALGLRYDPRIARTLDALDLTKPLPVSWDLFDKLAGSAVLTIRGERSDLLSAATLEAMVNRWPRSETMIVAGQGHAPLLEDDATLSRIDMFLAAADKTDTGDTTFAAN